MSRRESVDGPERSEGTGAGFRGQTTLPSLAVALLVLTVVAALALAMASGAITDADRDPGERRVARAVADRLTAPDGLTSRRANVLDADALADLDAADLRRAVPALDGRSFRVRRGDAVVAATGDPAGGTTVRRLVAVERRSNRTVEPALSPGGAVTVPRRTGRVTVSIDTPTDAAVWSVRADGRTVLHDDDGLDGTFGVALSARETTTLRFESGGPLPAEAVTVEYAAVGTTKTSLAVTVDG